MNDIEITKIGIVVIHSIPKGQPQTGDELCNEILKYKHYQKQKNEYFLWAYSPNTKTEFIDVLKNICERQETGMVFTLHIETHGDDEGICLADGSIISWKEFMQYIRPINIKMNHLLVIVLAMCVGGAIISSIEPNLRAPYRACICSTKKVSTDQIRRGFSAFYSEYTSPLDIVSGISALQTELDEGKCPYGPFRIISAREVFEQTFNLDRDALAKNHLINMAYVLKRSKNIMCSRDEVEQEIRNYFNSELATSLPYYDFWDIIYPK